LKALTEYVGLITAIVGLITIVAIILSPIIALNIQKKLDAAQENKARQLDVFRKLLITHMDNVSTEHMQALNMIDIEFYHEKEIRTSWNAYRNHLYAPPKTEESSLQEQWINDSADLLTALLYNMARLLEYKFDETFIKNGTYIPKALNHKKMAGDLLNFVYLDIATGKKPLKIELVSNPSKIPKQ
jgi:hypothetical protein